MAADDAQRRAAIARDLDGGRDAPVEIAEHDLAWADRFAREAARLRTLLPDLRPHHIGSTAVPGLAAKPIIDIMVLVEDLDAAIGTLTGPGGYTYPAAFNVTLEQRRWLCRPSAVHRTHHLHLVADPAILDRHLRFRDALRHDPALAERYGALKRRLAAQHREDREAYTQGKTTFVRDVLGEPSGG